MTRPEARETLVRLSPEQHRRRVDELIAARTIVLAFAAGRSSSSRTGLQKNAESVPFTFVTEGVEHAVELAKQAAGEKNVTIMGGDMTRLCLAAGLLDEIDIDLVPILLGDGVPLFRELADAPVELELQRVVDAPGVTHLSFRVVT